MLNYGAPSWVYGEITEIVKQTDVRELLLGQCCDGLFAIVAVLCMRPYCYKLYSRKCCILGEGKQLGGKTVGLQYPVWLLCNIDSNTKTRATTKLMSVCMSLLSAMRLSIIRGYTLHLTGYRHLIHHVRSND